MDGGRLAYARVAACAAKRKRKRDERKHDERKQKPKRAERREKAEKTRIVAGVFLQVARVSADASLARSLAYLAAHLIAAIATHSEPTSKAKQDEKNADYNLKAQL